MLLAVMAVGAWQRLDNLALWNANPERFFHGGLPLLMNVDGYYYLDLARSLDEGSYQPIDPDRVVPDGRVRPSPPPLLSLLTAGLKAITGIRLEWIAVVLPALLAGLVAIPLYGLGAGLGGPIAGLAAALFGVMAPFYVARTTLGWYDTDCLNITLILAIAWCAMRFAGSPGRAGYRWLAAAVAAWLVLLLWWDFGTVPATAAFLMPMTLAIAFRFRPRHWPAALALLGAGTVLLVTALSDIDWLDTLLGLFRYIGERTPDGFPEAAANVIEQGDWGIGDIAPIAIGSDFGFAAAMLGLIIGALTRMRWMLFLAFPLAVASLSFQAARFILFLAPMAALGTGLLLQWLATRPRRRYLGVAIAGAASVVLGMPLVTAFSDDDLLAPARFPYHAEALTEAQRITEQDAVIWADWGHGYPILYYARRGAMADGSNHSGTALYFLNVPLASEDPRLAANWMRFLGAYGVEGMRTFIARSGKGPGEALDLLRELLAAGPQAAGGLLQSMGVTDPDARRRQLAHLFPPMDRPLYLLLDFQKIQTPWFRYGSWDFARRDGPPFAHVPFAGLRAEGTRLTGIGVEVDAMAGTVRYDGRTHVLQRLAILEPGDGGVVHVRDAREFAQEGWLFDYHPRTGAGVLYTTNTAASLGHRLYAGKQVEGGYLRPVLARYPWYRLYRVFPDPPVR